MDFHFPSTFNSTNNKSFLNAPKFNPWKLTDYSTLHVNVTLNLKFSVHRKSSVNVTLFYISLYVWLKTHRQHFIPDHLWSNRNGQ